MQVAAQQREQQAKERQIDQDVTLVNKELSDISTVRQGASKLHQNFGQLQADENAEPSYQPTGAPSAQQVGQAASAADKSVSVTLSKVDAQIDMANGYVANAFLVAESALSNCPGGPGSLSAPPP